MVTDKTRTDPTPRDPTTEAGRRFRDALHDIGNPMGGNRDWALPSILAIEAAARAEGRQQAVREIREGATAHYRKYGGLPLAVVERILDRMAGLNASESTDD